MIAIRILVFLVGIAVTLRVLLSAILTFVLPRGVTDSLVRFLFIQMRKVFLLISHTQTEYERIDLIWALFAPVTLLMLPFVWVVIVIFSYAAMFWAAGVHTGWMAITVSGSSLLTLGFAIPVGHLQTALTFSEAAIGLFLIAILIAYLPTIYAAWSRREQLVTMLDTRAGVPPTPAELFIRFQRLGRLQMLTQLWDQWEVWFADVEESHTSLAALALFRSTSKDRSWLVAAGCVLDSAAIALSTVDVPYDVQAAIIIRTGTLTLRRLCDLFRLPYNPNPFFPEDSIAVTREEWEDVCRQMAETGVPLKADRDQAWKDFAGWRVNYARPLLALSGLTLAPPAPWTSDRSIPYPYGAKRPEPDYR